LLGVSLNAKAQKNFQLKLLRLDVESFGVAMLTQSRSRLPLLILVLALLVLFHRLLVGEVFFWGLPSLQFVPWRDYAFDLLRAGQLPFWNPFNGAGAPLLANYQSALLYPLHWPGLVLPLAWSMSVTAVLHLFLAGWGMWRFTGRLGLSPLGAGMSALSFALSGYLVARLGTYPTITAAAWLPWLLWAASGLLTLRRPRDAGYVALFAALLLLSGHAQTAWYTLLLVGAWGLYITLIPDRRGEQTPNSVLSPAGTDVGTPYSASAHSDALLRVPTTKALRVRGFLLLALAACILLGAGAAALQLLPTAELLGQSQRSGGVEEAFALNYSYAPPRILNLLSPNLFGTPADGSYYTQGAYFEDAVYIGLIPLISAVAAVALWVRRRGEKPASVRLVPFWLIVVVIGFAFALGRYAPLFPFLYENVPTFDLFQAPVRWHLWTITGLSVLAGIGAAAWGRTARLKRRARLTMVACIGAAVVLAVVSLTTNGTNEAVTILTRSLAFTALFGALASWLTQWQPEVGARRYGLWTLAVLLVLAADLIYANWGLNPTAPAAFFDPAPTATDQRTYLPRDAEEQVKFETFFRFDDYRIATERWPEVRAANLPNLNLLDRTPMLNNFEPLLVGHYAQLIDLIERGSSDSLLEATGVGSDRAWLASSMCWHETEAELEAALMDSAWRPNLQAHSLGDAGCPEPSEEAGEIITLRDEANAVTIDVNAARDSWLILADTDYPGWTATIDDEPAYIYRANLAFRALQVDAGMHTVRFEYRPGWLLPGAFVTALSALAILVLFRVKSPTSD
jgi:hypothetical protein